MMTRPFYLATENIEIKIEAQKKKSENIPSLRCGMIYIVVSCPHPCQVLLARCYLAVGYL